MGPEAMSKVAHSAPPFFVLPQPTDSSRPSIYSSCHRHGFFLFPYHLFFRPHVILAHPSGASRGPTPLPRYIAGISCFPNMQRIASFISMCLSHVCTILKKVFYGRTPTTIFSATQAQGELGNFGMNLEK